MKNNEVECSKCQEETEKWGLLESAGFSQCHQQRENETASGGGLHLLSLELATRRGAGRSEPRKEEEGGKKGKIAKKVLRTRRIQSTRRQ